MNAVLRQKAGAGRQVQETRAMSPARAFRLALARAGTAQGLPLETHDADAHLAPQQAVVEAVADKAMLLRLMRGDGQPGVLALDAVLLASLVECQILGRVSDRPPPERDPTEIDAALAVPFAEGVLREVLISGDPADQMRVQGKLARPGLLDALLTQPKYQMFQAEVTLTADRTGKAVMVLPLADTDAGPTAPPQSGAQKERPAPAVEAPAALHVVLCRVRRPLAVARGLKVGDTLPLPHGALQGARLEFDDAGAGVDVELGRLNGYRAVRLAGASPPAPHEPAEAPPDTTPVAAPVLEHSEYEDTPPVSADGV